MSAILVDTNVLVYAYDPRHGVKNELAQYILQRMSESRRGTMSVQTLAEFMRSRQKLTIPA